MIKSLMIALAVCVIASVSAGPAAAREPQQHSAKFNPKVGIQKTLRATVITDCRSESIVELTPEGTLTLQAEATNKNRFRGASFGVIVRLRDAKGKVVYDARLRDTVEPRFWSGKSIAVPPVKVYKVPAAVLAQVRSASIVHGHVEPSHKWGKFARDKLGDAL